MQTLTQFAPFVPLAQTLVWVLLVLVLIGWFNKPIRSLLDAIRRRIEGGSTIKLAGFELSDQLRPQPPAVQKERAEAEAREVVQQQISPDPGAKPISLPDAQRLYLQAEDLALRAIQAEYGVPLSRQVSAGERAEFDGVFIRDGKVYVVEAKLFLGYVTPSKLRGSLERISEAAWKLAGPNARIVLAIVYKSSEYIKSNADRVREAIAGFRVPIELRNYTLAELQRQFGATE